MGAGRGSDWDAANGLFLAAAARRKNPPFRAGLLNECVVLVA